MLVYADVCDRYKRPYDLHLNQLHKKLSLKMSLYAAPERCEDKVMLIIEQARDTHDRGLKSSLLGTQFTCFTGTKVQILTPEELAARARCWHAVKS